MKILVCVKRVPMTGGRIVLTDDERSIATRHLGFTISPHEECGVEEAVRIVAEHGGEVVVLTLGPAEAEEQIRDCMAIGADRGILLQIDGEEWDGQATAAAIVDAVRADGDDFDLILFGNESADAGNYQVGIRVAYALGRPVVNGLKGIAVHGAEVRCEREAPGGRDVFVVPLPAVLTVLEGLNLPRYPSVPGRLRAKSKPLQVSTPARPDSKLEKLRLAPAARQWQVGRDPRRRPVRRTPRRRGAAGIGDCMSVLVFVEAGDELSLQALALARGLGSPVHAVSVGEPADVAVDVLHVAQVDGSFAPGAWAASIVDVVERVSPEYVVAAGSEHGNEVLAHVAARLDLPFAANCTEVQGADVTRVRWGGSVLEEARLHAATKLLTVSPHSVAGEAAGAPAAVEEHTPSLNAADLVVRVTETVAASTGGISLADAKVVVSGGRGVGSAENFAIIEELAALLGGAVGCSRVVTSAGWRPHSDQVGQTGTKVAPDLYIACGISGATQHIAGCRGAKKMLVINDDPEAPILGHADYAVLGDLHEIVPAISAELRKARAQ